jgi:membrane-bound inhibitor of C-type lysozyme
MKIKKTIILIALLTIVFSAALYFSKKPAQSPVVDQENNSQVVGEIYTYVNASTSQELKVSYDNTNNTAIIYPNEVNKVVFNATTTGSGARYSNDEQGLILWNKGDDVSLYLNDSLIFTGTTNSF